jgi:GMP synthase-like glutamine amidotransferase
MIIGILKTDDVRPEWVLEFGQYTDMFIALLRKLDPELQFAVYDVQRGIYPADINEVDAYLITGSKSSVYDYVLWIVELATFVQLLQSCGKKLVGICFGHQLIAHALGGKVEKSSKGWGVGLHTHEFNSKPPWYDRGDANLDILVSHQDQVVKIANDAQVLAGSEFCKNAVCQIGEKILTFQGHPEFVPGYSRELMTFRRERIGEEVYQAGMVSPCESHEGLRVARWILNFLDDKVHSESLTERK